MNIFGTSFDYQSRLEKVRKLMDEKGIDSLLVYLWPNQYYLSGMYQHMPWYPVEVVPHTETPLIIFKDRDKEPVVLTTYLTGLGQKEGTWIKDVRIIDREPYGKMSWSEYIADVLKERGVDEGTIGIEQNVVVLTTFNKLREAIPKATFVDSTEIFERVRSIKEPEEIKIIRESVKIAEAGLKAGIEASEVGVLESEVQKAAEIEMKRRGALREVETMCQSGIRTANHRAFGANWKRIGENELTMMDIGCVFKGYGSDITRTWVVGKPSDAYKRMANDIVRTREKCLAIMKPGVFIRQIYELGQKEMRNAGYEINRLFMPSNNTGWGYVGIHGIGLGPMHDAPHTGDKETMLENGMVITFTGGVRYSTFTIRFEDDFIVMPRGIELINTLFPWGL